MDLSNDGFYIHDIIKKLKKLIKLKKYDEYDKLKSEVIDIVNRNLIDTPKNGKREYYFKCINDILISGKDKQRILELLLSEKIEMKIEKKTWYKDSVKANRITSGYDEETGPHYVWQKGVDYKIQLSKLELYMYRHKYYISIHNYNVVCEILKYLNSEIRKLEKQINKEIKYFYIFKNKYNIIEDRTYDDLYCYVAAIRELIYDKYLPASPKKTAKTIDPALKKLSEFGFDFSSIMKLSRPANDDIPCSNGSFKEIKQEILLIIQKNQVPA